jgi:hypothetical protein
LADSAPIDGNTFPPIEELELSILPGHSQLPHEPDTPPKEFASDHGCLLLALFGNQFMCPGDS